MSLAFEPIPPVPPETVRVAKAAFPKGNLYITLRDELGPIFGDADFAHLFSKTGQPAIPPWQLALITVMQFRENLSDRQAADAVRSRIDWKYLLGLELTDAGFDFSVLSEFRQRLIEGQAEHLLLDRLLEHCRILGLVKARGKQRTDATRVLASIRALSRLELVAETFRAVLNELATLVPEWTAQVALEPWYKRYGRRIEDTRLPKSTTERDKYAQTVGDDIDYLLKCLEESNLSIDWENLPSIIALKLIWQRHYEVMTDDQTGFKQVRFKPKSELTKAAEAVESPYDRDARYRSRHSLHWTGYMVHFSETCDDEDCHLMTQVMTTPATVHEVNCTDSIHQALIDKQLPPDEHFVDSAYVEAHLLVEAQAQGITMVGPARPNPTWQTKTENAFDFTQFVVDWEHQRVTCPQGKQSISWSPLIGQDGHLVFKAKFSTLDCGPCAARSHCTRAKPPAARSVLLMPQPQYAALKAARATHASAEGQQRYKRRAGIEGTLSQGVRAFGLRQTRYRGLAKTHLQNTAVATAMNFERLVNWVTGVPRAKTRVSRFAALAPD
ncbi:IS1182 family transposase [Leptolyngbya sp. FACHB-711]|uniref:IS1182 family transposase n=1 Tax=unclassified Leptolyngbya TaxID=2650499 RepID=UPI00168928A3|nr:IS1182 family transposase [Leptolyngbya sp. FACHB-711]MBD2024985.1 IS1182 family transposase [Leptolyngbya sp. FACHB-711]